MAGEEACMAGEGACMAGRGHVWLGRGVCVAGDGGMHGWGWGHAWLGHLSSPYGWQNFVISLTLQLYNYLHQTVLHMSL